VAAARASNATPDSFSNCRRKGVAKGQSGTLIVRRGSADPKWKRTHFKRSTQRGLAGMPTEPAASVTEEVRKSSPET